MERSNSRRIQAMVCPSSATTRWFGPSAEEEEARANNRIGTSLGLKRWIRAIRSASVGAPAGGPRGSVTRPRRTNWDRTSLDRKGIPSAFKRSKKAALFQAGA